MIEEATVDAYDESEQATGWFTMFEEHLELPFETTVLGTLVTVTRIDLRDYGQLNAICTRGRHSQAISLAELPLPKPRPAGSEWIAEGWPQAQVAVLEAPTAMVSALAT